MNHLQSVLLMILNDVDTLLKENDIPYFLDGGTALGAIRHKGFIPWDDDVDIVVLPEYWQKLDYVLRNKLDTNKYTYEQAHVDTIQQMSKIKLNNTHISEVGAIPETNDGIYIDIFCFDNARKSHIGKFFQYVCGRILISYIISQKPYETNSVAKKIAMNMAKVCKIPVFFKFILNQVRSQPCSKELCAVWDRSRGKWTKYFCSRKIFKSAVMVDFENCKFPVCSGYDTYLSLLYGDYMKLPPVEKQKGLHITSVDFGPY